MSYRRHRDHLAPWAREPRARHFGGGPSVPQPPPPMEFPPFPELPPIEFPEFPEFPEPQPFPAFPTFDPEAGEAKRRKEEQVASLRSIERRRKGYKATLLTGGQGDESEPPLKQPGLLGR